MEQKFIKIKNIHKKYSKITIHKSTPFFLLFHLNSDNHRNSSPLLRTPKSILARKSGRSSTPTTTSPLLSLPNKKNPRSPPLISPYSKKITLLTGSGKTLRGKTLTKNNPYNLVLARASITRRRPPTCGAAKEAAAAAHAVVTHRALDIYSLKKKKKEEIKKRRTRARERKKANALSP